MATNQPIMAQAVSPTLEEPVCSLNGGGMWHRYAMLCAKNDLRRGDVAPSIMICTGISKSPSAPHAQSCRFKILVLLNLVNIT